MFFALLTTEERDARIAAKRQQAALLSDFAPLYVEAEESAVDFAENDHSLRVPRTPELRANGFEKYLQDYRSGQFVRWQGSFRPTFATHVAKANSVYHDKSDLPRIWEDVCASAWVAQRDYLLQYAIRGIALKWLGDYLGGGFGIGSAQWSAEDDSWIVSLHWCTLDEPIFTLLFDKDGNPLSKPDETLQSVAKYRAQI